MSVNDMKEHTSVEKEKITHNDDSITFVIRNEPVMKNSIDVVDRMAKQDKIILYAEGIFIPNAVAVANILTETMLKDDVMVENILADTLEPIGFGKMTSTIKIILTKNS